MQQKRPNQEQPIDLVEQFYNQAIDHKALKRALAQKHKTELTKIY